MQMLDLVNTARQYHSRGGPDRMPPIPTKLHPDGLAVEFEVEYTADKILPGYDVEGFRVVNDGSLRNLGIEYVSTAVRPLTGVKNDLDRLFLVLGVMKPFITDKKAARTGFHVHGNTLNRTLTQTLTTITTYWLIESIVSPMCGEHREGSLFCLRAKDAPGQVDFLTKALMTSHKTGRVLFSNFNEGALKYAGLNLFTLVKFGSLEFRLMKGLFDVDLQKSWVQMCNQLMYELPFESPFEVLEAAWKYRENPREFLEILFKGNERLLKDVNTHWTDDSLKKEFHTNTCRLLTLGYLVKGGKKEWDDWFKGFKTKSTFQEQLEREYGQLRPAPIPIEEDD